MMITPMRELAFTAAFVVVIVLGLFFTSRIDLAFSSDLETFSGPRAYPRLVLLSLLALTLGTALGHLGKIRRGQTPDARQAPLFTAQTLLAGSLFVALVVFVLTFERIGYILTVVPLLIFVARLCGARSIVRAVIVAVCLSGICLLIFRYGLSTVLPEGIFGIDAVL